MTEIFSGETEKKQKRGKKKPFSFLQSLLLVIRAHMLRLYTRALIKETHVPSTRNLEPVAVAKHLDNSN